MYFNVSTIKQLFSLISRKKSLKIFLTITTFEKVEKNLKFLKG